MSRIRCVAQTCYNAQGCRPNLKFFSFPKDDERCRIWAENCGRLDIMESPPDKRARFKLCADHFEPHLFLNPIYKTVFKRNLDPVPTIFHNNLIDFVPKSLQLSRLYKNEASGTPTELHVEVKLSPSRSFTNDSRVNNNHPCANTRPCHKMCRLCASLVHEDKLTDIFTQDSKKIINQIKKILIEDVSSFDELPQYVCSHCEKKLDECEATIESFIAAEKKLKKLLLAPELIDFTDIPVVIDHEKDSHPSLKPVYDTPYDTPENTNEAISDSPEVIEETTAVETLNPGVLNDSSLHETAQALLDDLIEEHLESQFPSHNYKNVYSAKKSSKSTTIAKDDIVAESIETTVNVAEPSVSENLSENGRPGVIKHSSEFACGCEAVRDNEPELNPHRCSYCNEHFDDSDKLLIHEIEQHVMSADSNLQPELLSQKRRPRKERFQCSVCKSICLGKRAFRQHFRQYHLPPENVCRFCGVRYAVKSHLDAHVRLHTDETPFSCRICKEKFHFKKELRRHSRVHIKISENSLTCRICGKTYKSKSVLWRHKKIHDGSSCVLCYLCGKTLSSRQSLNVHLRSTHSSDRPYACPYCEKTFKDNSSHKKHVLKHSGKKSFTCFICDRSFYTQNLLTQHMLSHSGIKPHRCDICGSAFNRLGNLTQHKKKHNNLNPSLDVSLFSHECIVCGKKLRSELSLKYHVAKQHTGEKKPYDCQVCQKRFTALEPYRVHMRIHTGERPFECNICRKSFRSQYTLRQHAGLHADDCPYPCPFCERKFKRLQSLLVHKRTHTGEKPFECMFCGRSFAQKGDMLKHTKTHRKLPEMLVSSVTGEELVLEIDQITELALNDPDDIASEFLIDIPMSVVQA